MSRSSPLPRAQPGALIGGRYQVQGLLGKGGMGAVYAALDTTTGKRIAIKRLTHVESPKLLELFQREWQTLRGLRHAHIIEVYEYGSDQDGAYYTMELLEGGDLSAAAPLPWRQVCLYLREVAAILGLLHARRLLHRDLSARNLWRLPNGRIKLIDFGALAAFGFASETVGTPPLIAPESLRQQMLDQRVDLYGLGALGYWLLTSAHAYPARSLRDLEACWERTPVPPSSLVQLVQAANSEPVPAELDALLMSLLQLDPAARPASSDELIDRLNTLAGLEPAADDGEIQGYVHSKSFVGRVEERQRASQFLRDAQHGFKRALLVEAAPGFGRTRFLEELSVMARLGGATPITADTIDRRAAYRVANSLALRLLDALPQAALEAARPYASVLGNLSTELRERLQVDTPDVLSDKQARQRLQTALSAWLRDLCKRHSVLLLVDDLERADEESAAWLAALAREAQPCRLLLVAALRLDSGQGVPLAARAFQQSAERIRLQALTLPQTEELLRSIFGAVPYLQSTSELLHAISEGQPAYCLELVKYLVDAGVARYFEGTWTLPSHLNDAQLPRSRGDAHLARLAQLTAAARGLAQVLSVQDAPFSRAFCVALSELPAQDTTGALLELSLVGVVAHSDERYRFHHESLRDALLAELDASRRARAERKLAECLLERAAGDSIERLRAAIPLFRSGARADAEQLVREAASFLLQGHGSRYGTAAPLMEQVVALYRAAGSGDYTLVLPLAILGSASYFVDHRFAGRYGDAALDVLEKLLHFELARRLRPVIGAKLALYAALSAAGLDLARHRPRAPRLAELLRMLIGTAAALNAVATSSVDTVATARYRRALEPLAVLGDDNVAGFLQRCVVAVGKILVDRPSEALRSLHERSVRLDSPKPIRNLPEQLRIDCLGGCNLSIGVLECWRHSPRALELADRIEQYGPTFAMSADQLRSTYYADAGDLARAAHHRERVEAHALSLGATWQVATWLPMQSYISALWTSDAMLAKRAAQELSRLASELPAFNDEAIHARATYLALRGRHADVIAHLALDNTPPGRVGWTRIRGLLARAHNGLGDHTRARELCLEALAPLSDEDRSFVMMSLHVQIELALAEAGLGQLTAAREQLAGLIARHAEQGGPLICGALHEASARVAISAQDFDAARAHFEQMRAYYQPTGIATLLELVDTLARRLEVAEHGPSAVLATLTSADERLATRVRLILSHTDASLPMRAQKSLQIALELSGADDGFLMVAEHSGTPVAYSGSTAPDEALVAWARERLQSASAEETAIETYGSSALGEHTFKVLGRMHYCVVALWTDDSDADSATAAIALGFYDRRPRLLDREVLSVIADHLFDARGA
jgi:hypothetical protein